MIRGLEYPSKERLRPGVLSLEKIEGILSMLINIYRAGVKRTGCSIFSGAQQQDKGQQAQTRAKEVP